MLMLMLMVIDPSPVVSSGDTSLEWITATEEKD